MNEADQTKLVSERLADIRKTTNIDDLQFTIEVAMNGMPNGSPMVQFVVTESVNNGDVGACLTGRLNEGVLFIDWWEPDPADEWAPMCSYVKDVVVQEIYKSEFPNS